MPPRARPPLCQVQAGQRLQAFLVEQWGFLMGRRACVLHRHLVGCGLCLHCVLLPLLLPLLLLQALTLGCPVGLTLPKAQQCCFISDATQLWAGLMHGTHVPAPSLPRSAALRFTPPPSPLFLCPSKGALPLKRCSAPQKDLCPSKGGAMQSAALRFTPFTPPPFFSAPQKVLCPPKKVVRCGARKGWSLESIPRPALPLVCSAPEAHAGELLCTTSTDWGAALHQKHRLAICFAPKAQTDGLLCTKSTN